ncbi:MAG TPA: flagellar motor protein MotB [Dongiaceae bacterium]|nr:flagellar motor protein MotB [Dongiaceae bacterium]
MSKRAHHGGSWKVAYADFVTAMMALFLVLWLTAQDTRVKEAIERAFRNPFSSATKESVGIIPNKDVQATRQQKGNFDSVSALHLELLRRLTDDLAKLLQQDPNNQESVQLDLTSDGLRINMFDRAQKPLFEPDSARLTTYGSWVFSTLAWEIGRYPTFALELSGHTEAGHKSLREDYGDWELSADRANAARRKLLQHGVAKAQVCRVSGLGDTQPMANTRPADDINRRVSVLLRVQEGTQAESTGANQPNTTASFR